MYSVIFIFLVLCGYLWDVGDLFTPPPPSPASDKVPFQGKQICQNN